MWHNAASVTSTAVPDSHTFADVVLRLGKSESIGNRNIWIIDIVCKDADLWHPSPCCAVCQTSD